MLFFLKPLARVSLGAKPPNAFGARFSPVHLQKSTVIPAARSCAAQASRNGGSALGVNGKLRRNNQKAFTFFPC